jgi:hypothetical protein
MSDATFGDTTDESDSAIGGVGSYAFVLSLPLNVRADGEIGRRRIRLVLVCLMR